jgi:hypothetical protein
MQLRLRQCLVMFGMLVAGACADSPTAPTPSPENTRPGGIVYYPPDDGGGCNKYTDPNFCQGRRTGECITSTPGTVDSEVGVQSCDGSGGGGGTTQPPDPPADTCLTGDEAFDDPAVKQGLNDLWTRSNPAAAQAQRLEQGGWIVRNWDGSYSMAPFTVTAQGPCSIKGNFNAPAGTVAWVHTHPFTSGEVQTICGALKLRDPYAPGGFRDAIGPSGQPVYPVYRNTPSIPDRELMSDVNALQAALGRDQLAGVIIDANQTTVYTENTSDGTTTLPRCGY